jgi:hypothetical protein
MTTYTLKQNDTAPVIEATLQLAGSSIDLTGATVKFHMADKSSGAIKVNAAATPDPDQVSNKGKVSYTWISADLNTEGTYSAEWEITFASGKIMTVPNTGYDTVTVVKELA